MGHRIKKKKTRLLKQAARGYRGYPAATLAFYGPDDKRASKIAVGIVLAEGADVSALERWYCEDGDIRQNEEKGEQILAFIKEHGVKTVAASDRIIGCPHEEGKDYPEGEECPDCPFWQGRDRFSGKMLH